MADTIARFIRDFARTVSPQLASLLENASGLKMNWSNVVGIAAIVVALYALRRGNGRKPSNETMEGDATSNGTSTTIPNASEAAPTGLRQRLNPESAPVGVTSPAATSTGVRMRRRLKGVQRVTCTLLGSLFEEATPEGLKRSVALKPAAVEVLRELSSICEVFYIIECHTDDAQEAALKALQGAGLVGKGKGLVGVHRALFCSTKIGRTAIVRQMEPDLHIDTCPDTMTGLARYVPRLLYVQVGSNPIHGASSNITSTPSLAAFFAGAPAQPTTTNAPVA
mmetsp:Transcript_40362/g.48930  ORF Transcript_40362/g.48930 Transcript_40362/m.48930 type:complete len:281 (+) Transcript_40362:267-1109(+)|eukprot:CAMPEP_0197855146 /NCGR_PEP_ID=MMETSP1438-20131217/26077_1 /TAXON_ID=1461541 /ORGANISM="Pterosperma sp., Strain CCMP1384" /LENGTH=280 /DNA_ID=CAMNT_0043470149 /DNA_START=249 /DNA_END=1091 /DNA_ORIENTATION=-